MKMNFSLDAALIVTTISALLFLIGHAFLAGYLREFGADIAVINFSIQDKLYFGYLRVINHAIYFIFFIIIIFVFIPFLYKEMNGKKLLNRLITKIRTHIHVVQNHPPIHNTIQENRNEKDFNQRLISTYFIFFTLIGSLSYLSYIEKFGKEKAQFNLAHVETTLVKIAFKNQSDQQAYKVLCGNSVCAVLMIGHKTKTLRYVDPKNIEFPIN